MEIYCKSALKKVINNVKEPEPLPTRNPVPPVLSVNRLNTEYNMLCNNWELKFTPSTGSGINAIKAGFKNFIKSGLYRVFNESINRQQQFDRSVINILDDLIKQASYLDGQAAKTDGNFIVVCRDSIKKESHLQEIALAVNYFMLHYWQDTSLIFLHDKVEDPIYLDLLQNTLEVMDLRSASFVITNNTSIINEYLEKASIEISLKDIENPNHTSGESINPTLPCINFSSNAISSKDQYAGSSDGSIMILVDELNTAGIAKAMEGIREYHDVGTQS